MTAWAGVGGLATEGCASLSLAAGEPMAGTAPALRRLVAVEHVGAWPPRVAAHPDEAVADLAARLREQDAVLLLIRRTGRRGRRIDGDRTVLVWPTWRRGAPGSRRAPCADPTTSTGSGSTWTAGRRCGSRSC